MNAPDFEQQKGERGFERTPAQGLPQPSPRTEALEGLAVPSDGRGGFDLPAPSLDLTGGLGLPEGEGASLGAIKYFFKRKELKEQRIGNSRSLKERIQELNPAAVQGLEVEPAKVVDPEVVTAAIGRLQGQEHASDLQHLLSSFPVFGGAEDRTVCESELDGLTPDFLGTEKAILSLRSIDLVEPREQLGEWQLTDLGEAVVRKLMLEEDPATSGDVLDAQAAFLTGRLVTEPKAAGAFLEAAVYLLAHGLLESENGHPTRWGTAVRAVRNAVVVDLERPGSMLAGAGGLRSKDIATLGSMAAISPVAGGAVPPEFRTLVVALTCRERIQERVGQDQGLLREALLDSTLYKELENQMVGLKAMAHVAWVALSRGVSPRELQTSAQALAHSVMGVCEGGVFHPADFALLTPDHREHLLLVAAAKENPGFLIEGSLSEARRRLAMMYGQLVEEYPHVGERTRAAGRILALHTGYGNHKEDALLREAGMVMEQVEDSRGFTDELTSLALRLQPGAFNKNNTSLAVHTLARRYAEVESSDRAEGFTDTMLAAAEWVAVAERFGTFHTMQEGQAYRYALMEALERQGFKRSQREAMKVMLGHATSLMTVLAQQDQGRTIPEPLKEIMVSMTTPQLMEIIEGDGGRFGVARLAWQESERGQTFRRLIEYSGLGVAFPEEMNLVSRNLLQLLGSHVAPGEARRKMDAPQKEMLEQRLGAGAVSDDLTEADARDGLAFVQSVEMAKNSGLLRTYEGAGVTLEEAIRSHETV